MLSNCIQLALRDELRLDERPGGPNLTEPQAPDPGLSISANPLLSLVGLDEKRLQSEPKIVESR